ncbi:MAG TPA: glycosyltransferase family 2 protein [Thermoleophilaceae bacterium]
MIVAQDEEERLERCVASCRSFADEIVVVDGGSSDGTVETAQRLDCTVLENPWPGFGRQRNFGAEHAAHDWVFWIDADEVVGADLARAIEDWKHSEDDDRTAGLSVRRVGDFMGQWLEGKAGTLVRLYDRRRCRVAEVPVHETVQTDGQPVTELGGTLWHYGFRSLSDHVRRFDRYTTLEAEAALESGRRFSFGRLLLRPPTRFLKELVGSRLYSNGLPGLTVCLLWVYYELMAELKLLELEWRRRGGQHERAGS